MNEWVWSNGGMILTVENWSTGRKTLYSLGGRWMNEYGAMVEWYWQGKAVLLWRETCSSATLLPINLTWTLLVSNPILRGGRPATYHPNQSSSLRLTNIILQYLFRTAQWTYSVSTSRTVQSAWYHFTRRGRFYGDLGRTETIKYTEVFMCSVDSGGTRSDRWDVSIKMDCRRKKADRM